jgi:lon-related putative ATP-dependent protease
MKKDGKKAKKPAPAARWELAPPQLAKACRLEGLGFKTTAELAKTGDLIGQPRALASLAFAIGIRKHGYNAYAVGMPGTGKTSKVKSFLASHAKREPVPDDWCYINNFDDPMKPRAIRLPAGMGKKLAKDMENLVEELRADVPRAFESEDYERRRNEIIQRFQGQRAEVFSELEKWAASKGFNLVQAPGGIVVVPVKDGKPLPPEEYQKLSDEERNSFEERGKDFQDRMSETTNVVRAFEKELKASLAELDREVASLAVGQTIDELEHKYRDTEAVVGHLEAVRRDLLENVDALKATKPQGSEPSSPVEAAAMLQSQSMLDSYAVNVIIDNSESKGAPVVFEMNPTHANLVGRIDHRVQMGAVFTDFRQIRPGALHKSNGGYLVMEVKDVLTQPFAWDALKRGMKNRQVRVEDPFEQLRIFAPTTLEPEPIPLDFKVVLLGTPLYYYLLQAYDEDFDKLFKVKADFDSLMPCSKASVHKYADFVATICQEESLRDFDRTAVARVVEFGSRLVEDQTKLSAQFGDIANLLREADYWAADAGKKIVGAEHVDRALEHKIYRSNRIQERIQEMIRDGTIVIDTRGKKAGQVNGLSVIELGDLTFGRPSRITASISLGRENFLDIERETQLGGPIHTKGVLILTGYLANRFGQRAPLSISARLCFEQSYSGVEGDSASSAELYALLSALSGVPLRQDIAVTGSVDQKGRVQAIGGAIYKIEGFFDVCRAKGLTGSQGVMIPKTNTKNLMLRPDVVEAVGKGKFHIWAIDTVEDGIEILTGMPAGKARKSGTYPDGTLYHIIEERLADMAERWRTFARGGENGRGNEKENRSRRKPGTRSPRSKRSSRT